MQLWSYELGLSTHMATITDALLNHSLVHLAQPPPGAPAEQGSNFCRSDTVEDWRPVCKPSEHTGR